MVHAAINGVPTNRPTNQAPKQPNQRTVQPTQQPTNQATKPHNSAFSQNCRRYLACMVGEALRPLPHPSRLYLQSIHPSIHPFILQTSKPTEKLYIHQALYHAINQHQASQPTTPVHDPSITVCVLPKCCRYLNCFAGEALHPPPHPFPPLSIYTAPIQSIHQPTDQPTKQQRGQTKQPTNRETEPRNFVFSRTCHYLVSVAGEVLRPSPHPLPPSFTEHPSIHSSSHQTSKQTEQMHIHQALYHAIHQHQTSQPANQHTNQRKEGEKERVEGQKRTSRG